MSRRPRGRRLGFTLVELIVVAAIIAVLAALAIPVSSRVIQSSKAAACISNLNSLGAALGLYLGDHNQTMPTLEAGRSSLSENVAVIDDTLNAYATDPRVFACPADPHFAAATGTSYFWNNVLNGQSTANLKFFFSKGMNSEIPVICDKEGFHPYTANKVNVLYADGHTSQELKFVAAQ
jgi:prepilin-type N-terminal cleavage/methylation domain-containing protein/prepilin-type processing-associated H-X9-DG protein